MMFFLFTAVRGQWTPLVELIEPCGFTLDGEDGALHIAAPFITCGITVMVNFRGSPVMKQVFHYSYSAFWREVKCLIFQLFYAIVKSSLDLFNFNL